MSLGPVEIAMIGGAALLLFGPEQFPKVARKAGSIVRDLQTTSQSFIREMERAADSGDAPFAREDLIATGSGAGPQPKAHEPFRDGSDDVVEVPGLGTIHDDEGAWAYSAPPVHSSGSPLDEPGELGFGSAIDPSATLILAGDGDVRHSVTVAEHVAESAPAFAQT